MMDLVIVWDVVVASTVAGMGLLWIWTMLRQTADQTAVGVWLKWLKVAMAVFALANAVYWGTVLVSYYTGYVVTLWERRTVLLVFAGGITVGAVIVWIFALVLRREVRRKRGVPLVEEGGEA